MLLGKAISTGYAEEVPLLSEEPAEIEGRVEGRVEESAEAPVEVPAG